MPIGGARRAIVHNQAAEGGGAQPAHSSHRIRRRGSSQSMPRNSSTPSPTPARSGSSAGHSAASSIGRRAFSPTALCNGDDRRSSTDTLSGSVGSAAEGVADHEDLRRLRSSIGAAEKRHLLNTWDKIRGKSGRGVTQLTQRIFANLFRKDTQLKQIYSDNMAVTAFDKTDRASTEHDHALHMAHLLQELVDWLAGKNAVCMATMPSDIGARHACLGRHGMTDALWENVGRVSADVICSQDGIRHLAPAHKAWNLFLAIVLDQITHGFHRQFSKMRWGRLTTVLRASKTLQGAVAAVGDTAGRSDSADDGGSERRCSATGAGTSAPANGVIDEEDELEEADADEYHHEHEANGVDEDDDDDEEEEDNESVCRSEPASAEPQRRIVVVYKGAKAQLPQTPTVARAVQRHADAHLPHHRHQAHSRARAETGVSALQPPWAGDMPAGFVSPAAAHRTFQAHNSRQSRHQQQQQQELQQRQHLLQQHTLVAQQQQQQQRYRDGRRARLPDTPT